VAVMPITERTIDPPQLATGGTPTALVGLTA
jgi:hypothetical protein